MCVQLQKMTGPTVKFICLCPVKWATILPHILYTGHKFLSFFLSFLPPSLFLSMHVMDHNWSAKKQHLHLRSVAEISRHSALSRDRIRQCGTSSESHQSVSVSRHFLQSTSLQAPQCPCSMQKRFSRDHCCQRRSKPICQIVGSHIRWELTTADCM